MSIDAAMNARAGSPGDSRGCGKRPPRQSIVPPAYVPLAMGSTKKRAGAERRRRL